MTPTATVLLVFGRGVVAGDDGYRLTAESAARTRAAIGYVRAHATEFRRAAGARVVFTGGWPHGPAGAQGPPAGSREGELMLALAHAAGLDGYARLHAETRSRTTLQNLAHTVQDGLLAGRVYTPARPLGLVSHPWHLPRIRFLAGKVLGLTGAHAAGRAGHRTRPGARPARAGRAGGQPPLLPRPAHPGGAAAPRTRPGPVGGTRRHTVPPLTLDHDGSSATGGIRRLPARVRTDVDRHR
ncbi:YdcF family protein [Micromonospora chersina]|uniref:YdcF family protein n=1 Tax=Micromonospora chersina TaxID=47854 RepID=UPI00378AC9DD